jgi:phosphoglycolate phosphatase
MKVLATDLDNTLYDWVTFFATSFKAMLGELVKLLGVSEQDLVAEFKSVHEELGTSERPYAALDLPTVKRRFPNATRDEIKNELDPAFQAFNQARQETLRLYPGVESTLRILHDSGVTILGHTESEDVNAYHRLRLLGVDRYFDRVYARSSGADRENLGRTWDIRDAGERLRLLAPDERKPDPRVLLDICKREEVMPSDVVYVGDSLARDVRMANAAGTISVWAAYGADFDPTLWALLVSISHWSKEQVAGESDVPLQIDAEPRFVIRSFSELLTLRVG